MKNAGRGQGKKNYIRKTKIKENDFGGSNENERVQWPSVRKTCYISFIGFFFHGSAHGMYVTWRKNKSMSNGNEKRWPTQLFTVSKPTFTFTNRRLIFSWLHALIKASAYTLRRTLTH